MDRAGPIAHGLRTASGLQALMIDNDSTNAAANQLMHQQDVASLGIFEPLQPQGNHHLYNFASWRSSSDHRDASSSSLAASDGESKYERRLSSSKTD